MSAPFNAGDVVVCVDDRLAPELRRGALYRIASMCGPAFNELDETVGFGVILVGVSPMPHGEFIGFDARRFRKIDDEQIPEVLERLKAIKSPKPVLDPSRHSRELEPVSSHPVVLSGGAA